MIYQKPVMQDVVRVSCMAGFCDEYEKNTRRSAADILRNLVLKSLR